MMTPLKLTNVPNVSLACHSSLCVYESSELITSKRGCIPRVSKRERERRGGGGGGGGVADTIIPPPSLAKSLLYSVSLYKP